MRPFTVMAKPVGSTCNMQCTYCYYRNVYKEPHLMPDHILELFIKKYIDETTGQIVPFFWHGGEPTLAGLSFYQKVVAYQNKYLTKHKKVWNNIQTNGLGIDEAWCCFFKENNFDVGVSIDGSMIAHDHYRRDLFDNPSYDRIITSIELLKHHDISVDLLCTINAFNVNYPKETYQALAKLNTGWIQFIPIIELSDDNCLTAESISSEAYGIFMIEVFKQWITNDIDKIKIQTFADIELVNKKLPATVCQTSRTCGNVLVIENDGSLYACDHYVGKDYFLGNIVDKNLRDALNSHQQIAFGQVKSDLVDECEDCKWLKYCYGGCTKNRFINKDNLVKYHLCEGVKTMHKHIEKPFNRYFYLLAKNHDPKSIMAKIKEDYY